MKWIMSLLFALLMVCLATAQVAQPMNREVRNFPYSVNLFRMVDHGAQARPYYGPDDEVAAMIDELNADQMPRLRRSETPIKRYACRFKFCRLTWDV